MSGLTAARRPPRLNENSGGAIRGRRDAVQFGAAHGGSERRANGSATCQLV